VSSRSSTRCGSTGEGAAVRSGAGAAAAGGGSIGRDVDCDEGVAAAAEVDTAIEGATSDASPGGRWNPASSFQIVPDDAIASAAPAATSAL
jgi:hypothetical protein